MDMVNLKKVISKPMTTTALNVPPEIYIYFGDSRGPLFTRIKIPLFRPKFT